MPTWDHEQVSAQLVEPRSMRAPRENKGRRPRGVLSVKGKSAYEKACIYYP